MRPYESVPHFGPSAELWQSLLYDRHEFDLPNTVASNVEFLPHFCRVEFHSKTEKGRKPLNSCNWEFSRVIFYSILFSEAK